MHKNQIQSLPPKVGQWTAAKNIYLSTNRLQSLPPEVVQWTGAGCINLYHNPLQSLPPVNILKYCNGINYEKININQENLRIKVKDLEEEIQKLKEENLHLRYAYGGEGFQDAMDEYDILKNQKN